MPFVKLDTSILDSTLWLDTAASRVFLTALCMAQPYDFPEPMEQLEVRTLEKTGFVVPPGWYGWIAAAGTGIIRRSMLSDIEGYAALEALGKADRESRSPEFEGRHLVRVDGGYIVLNFMKFRDRDYGAADRMRRLRERKKPGAVGAGVTDVRRNVTHVRRNVTQAEAEAEDREQKADSVKGVPGKHLRSPTSSTAGAADAAAPFFADVVLTEAEAKSNWSAPGYRHFWNRYVSAEVKLTDMSEKWVKAIDDFREGRGLTPATFLAALKTMEQTAPIQSCTDFFNAMNFTVRQHD
jgi:hypothetical protein